MHVFKPELTFNLTKGSHSAEIVYVGKTIFTSVNAHQTYLTLLVDKSEKCHPVSTKARL